MISRTILSAILPRLPGSSERLEEIQGLTHRQGGDLRQVVIRDEYVARGLVQAGAAAVPTGMGGDIAGQFFAYRVGLGIPVTALHVADDALEGMGLGDAAPPFVVIAEADGFFAAAVQDQFPNLVRQVFERGLHVKPVVFAQGLDELEIVGVAPVPAPHRARRRG